MIVNLEKFGICLSTSNECHLAYFLLLFLLLQYASVLNSAKRKCALGLMCMSLLLASSD